MKKYKKKPDDGLDKPDAEPDDEPDDGPDDGPDDRDPR